MRFGKYTDDNSVKKPGDANKRKETSHIRQKKYLALPKKNLNNLSEYTFLRAKDSLTTQTQAIVENDLRYDEKLSSW